MKKKLCLLAALTLSVSLLGGCTKIQARMEIREGNDAYRREDYKAALTHYTKARQIDPSFADLDRMIGYSRIGMYTPEDTSPANEQIADQAVAELRRYLQKRPDDNVAREALINLYLNANRTTDAINFFREYLQRNPADLAAVRSVAQLYAKQGNFNESLNWYEKITLLDSKNPEAFYIFGVVCYEKVAKNPPADMAERLNIIEKGKAALQRSIDLKPDYFESMAYLNLLYRQQALVETDPAVQQELIAKADAVRSQAVEIIKARKAAAAGQQKS
ncbi:MAG TPA: tetratricopeptide repeat protein [Thermoanaerobaculia bacterium]|nr:tetratricopeptide repeat protein [Thermoanaerobaculia bacterium]